MLAAYGALVAVFAATRLHQPGMALVLVAHLGVPALAWLLANAPLTATTRILRGIYPLLLLSGLYSAIDVFNRFGAAATWDHQIQALEHAVFGMQPSRDWWRAHPSAFWSATLHSAYLSYYLIVTTPVIFFLLQRRSDALERYLNGLLATYLVCYLFYLFLPVAGPYYEFPRPSGAFVANLPARLGLRGAERRKRLRRRVPLIACRGDGGGSHWHMARVATARHDPRGPHRVPRRRRRVLPDALRHRQRDGRGSRRNGGGSCDTQDEGRTT